LKSWTTLEAPDGEKCIAICKPCAGFYQVQHVKDCWVAKCCLPEGHAKTPGNCYQVRKRHMLMWTAKNTPEGSVVGVWYRNGRGVSAPAYFDSQGRDPGPCDRSHAEVASHEAPSEVAYSPVPLSWQSVESPRGERCIGRCKGITSCPGDYEVFRSNDGFWIAQCNLQRTLTSNPCGLRKHDLYWVRNKKTDVSVVGIWRRNKSGLTASFFHSSAGHEPGPSPAGDDDADGSQ